MAALFKYFLGVTVILSVIVVLSALTVSEIFAKLPAATWVATKEAPRWNIERLRAEAKEHVGHGSLSPLYPATPGKELLGKPVFTARANRINVSHALQLRKLPLQLYPQGRRGRNFPQQSLSYTEIPQSPPRMSVIFGHEIY